MLKNTYLYPLILSLSCLILLTPAIATAADQVVKLDAKRNTQKNPAQLYLRAGTYKITPVGRHHGGDKGAWSVWGHTTCKHPRGCRRTVPTKFTGLHNNYYVMSDQLGTVMVNGKKLTPVTETPTHRMHSYYLADGTQRAYEVAQPMVYANEASALAGALSSTFVMTQGGRIKFALLDNSRISDNRGGMSLKISKINTAQ
ncbi:MAG: hypothetical protein ACPGSM_15190 [Thiolinea sp.]